MRAQIAMIISAAIPCITCGILGPEGSNPLAALKDVKAIRGSFMNVYECRLQT